MPSNQTNTNITNASLISYHLLATSGIALVDDHVLLRKGLCELIRGFDKYDILFEADNGMDLLKN